MLPLFIIMIYLTLHQCLESENQDKSNCFLCCFATSALTLLRAIVLSIDLCILLDLARGGCLSTPFLFSPSLFSFSDGTVRATHVILTRYPIVEGERTKAREKKRKFQAR